MSATGIMTTITQNIGEEFGAPPLRRGLVALADDAFLALSGTARRFRVKYVGGDAARVRSCCLSFGLVASPP